MRTKATLLASALLLAMLFAAPTAVAADSLATPGRWEANGFFIVLYLRARPLYDLFVAAGFHVYNCVARDGAGNVIGEGVCTDPMPEFNPR